MKTNNKCAAVRLEKSKLVAALAILAVAFVVIAAVPAVDGDSKAVSPKDVGAITDLTGSVAGTYKLTNNLETESSINISAEITLDLNGFTLKGKNCDTITVSSTGKLTIVDNSDKKTGTVDVVGNGKAAIKNEGITTLDGGIYERSGSTYTYGGAEDEYKLTTTDSFYTIQNLGTMTINSVTIKGYVPATTEIAEKIRTDSKFGAASCVTNGYYAVSKVTDPSVCKLTINGATINGGLNTVKNDDYGELLIKNGTFTNYIQVSLQNHHIATIEGGYFDGAQSAVHNHPCDDTYDKGMLTVNGGTFKYTAGYADVWDNGNKAGKVTIGEGVDLSLKLDNSLTTVVLSKDSSVSFTNESKLPATVSYDGSSASFTGMVAKNGVKIAAGSVEISGSLSASEATATINNARGDVVLKNLVITEGTLNLNNVKIDGKVTVKEGVTVNTTGVSITSNGNLVVAGKVTGTGLTNDGTITITTPAAEVPSAIGGSGSIDASGAQAEGTLSGSYDTTTTFTKNQIITATGNITLVKGTIFTFKGTFIIPEGVTVTIEDGARLIAADATGKIVNNGTIIVESRVADGGLYLSDTATIENNGTIDLTYEGTSTQWSAYLKQGRFINNGTLTVGEGSNLILGESGKKLEFDNRGTITVYGEINYRTDDVTILNSGLFQMNGKTYTDFTIYQMSTDASVEFNEFTNMYTTSNTVTITVSDAKYKLDDAKYDHTGSTVAVTAGYKDVVSGIKVALTAEKDKEGKFFPQFVISGNAHVDTEEENGTAYAAIVTAGDNMVSDALTIGENVTLTIGGAFKVSGQISAVKNSSVGFAAAADSLIVTGKVSVVSASGLTGGIINASAYVIAQTTTTDKTYVYTTLATAIADGAKKIEVLGTNEVSESITVPGETTVTVAGNLNITDDGIITFSEGSVLKNNDTINVDGVLYIADKKNSLKTVGDINSQVIIEGEKDKTYCNVTYALNNATSGSTVKLSEDNTSVDIDKSMTIPAGVTLDTNGVNVNIAEKVILTVDGTLQITSPSVVTLNGTDSDKAKIVLNGTVASPDNAIPDNLGIAGAFYSITVKTTTTYYAKPVADAAAIIATVDDATIDLKGGDLTVGDVSFIGTSDKSATINVYSKLTASTITLDLASIEFKAAVDFNGTITNVTGTVAVIGDAAIGFKVASTTSDDKKVLTVSGQFNNADKDDKFVVTGEVVAKNATLSAAKVDGLLKIAKGTTTVTDLIVNGTVEVQNEATLNATTIEVFGTLSAVEESTTGASAGAVSSTYIFVGISKKDSIRTYLVPTTAASATVSGEVAAIGYAVVADGSAVPERLTKDIKSTAYFIGDKAYVTVYAPTTTQIGVVKATVENASWTGWYADDKTKTDISDKNVGDAGYEKVYAIVDYSIYNVTVSIGAGIENVAIDGNLLTSYASNSNGYVMKGLKAGTHTVTYSLSNGYSGTATLTVNGEKQSGMTFSVSGKTTEYSLQLSGVTASGYTPAPTPAPSTGDDDGLSITDYLLIVLVILIVIMAIIVAMRLMRS